MSENLLIKALLRHSPYMWDSSAWENLIIAFRDEPEEHRIEFIRVAREMPYKQYLRTVYWGVIRGHMVAKSGACCRNCRSRYGLQIHHVSYEHRGEEYAHLEDLDILCRECHKNNHGLASFDDLTKIRKRRVNAWRYPLEHPSDGSPDTRYVPKFLRGIRG